MDTNIKLGIGVFVGIVVGVLMAPLFIGSRSEWTTTMPMMGRGDSYGLRGEGAGAIDRHFIEQMISHHEGAIAMAELAFSKSKRPEILSLSEGIIEAQNREIADMRLWYRNWFRGDVPEYSSGFGFEGMMGHGMMHMGTFSGDLDELSSATNFDLEFISQMIPHHEMAIMMANMLLATTEQEEMKILADQIITSQSREIEMMRSWARAWQQ